MLTYLIILLDKTSASYCHYHVPEEEPQLMPIDVLSRGIVWAMKEEEHNALVERIVSRHGLRQLSYMKELGMGNNKYVLIDLDNGGRRMTVKEAVQGLKPFTY